MKKTFSVWPLVLSLSSLGILASSCSSHPARGPAAVDVDQTTSFAPEAPSDEFLRPEQRAEKSAVCGEDSMTKDSLADYPKTPTPSFPAYVRVLADPHEAVLAKIALIQNAKISIDLSTYIFTPDESSRAYIQEIGNAIKRGVNVRILVDAGGSATLAIKDYYNTIRALLYVAETETKLGHKPGRVDVVVFRPILRFGTIASNVLTRYFKHEDLDEETIWNFDRRSHDKILVVDKEDRANSYAIAGGRNIDNSYYGVPQVDGATYNDMELLVKDDANSGSSLSLANTLDKHFQDLFCAKGNRWVSTARWGTELSDVMTLGLFTPIKDLNKDPKISKAHDALLACSDLGEKYKTIWGPNNNPMAYFNQNMVHANIHPASEEENITRPFNEVYVDPNKTYKTLGDNGDSIYGTFMQQVQSAEHTIDILTPYIFLPPDEQDCLKVWVMAEEGRHVRLLSNSVSSSDSALAMQTFDQETAPAMAPVGDKALTPQHVSCTLNGKTYSADFVNGPLGSQKIEVFELGRLDNKMFAGETINGQPAKATQYYGKLHAKFAIVDGHLSWVGSDNLDERSRHLNSETAIFVDSAEIGAQLEEQYNIFVSKSVHYGDDDWKTMQTLPPLQKRIDTMNAAAWLSEMFPRLGFGD